MNKNQELSTEVKQTALSKGYDNIDGMMKFVAEFGAVFSGMGICGVKNASEGKVLALACFLERKNPFEIDDQYHIIGGKLSMKPDFMLSELRSNGGSYKWINDGSVSEDGSGVIQGEAVLETTYLGETNITKFSMNDARRAQLVKKDSGYDKRPDAMLRARVVTKAGRMYFPDILKGRYAPDELEEVAESKISEQPTRTKHEVEARAAEIRGEAVVEPAPTPQPAEEIVDAEFTPTETPAANPEPVPDNTGFDQAMISLEEVLTKMKMSKESLEELLKKSRPDFTSLENMSAEQIRTLEANLRKKLES